MIRLEIVEASTKELLVTVQLTARRWSRRLKGREEEGRKKGGCAMTLIDLVWVFWLQLPSIDAKAGPSPRGTQSLLVLLLYM